MSRFALPIKHSYVPSWGVWQCIREFVQNAKDEEDARGVPMQLRVLAGGDVLELFNPGAVLDKSALLLGHTTKAGRADQRGQFGEGLNLALLVGVREKLDIVIHTGQERWHPLIEEAPEFGHERCLVIQSRKLQKDTGGVRVTIKGLNNTSMPWSDLRKRFIFLCTFNDRDIVRQGQSAILLDPEYAGQIFARGVYVTTMPRFRCGYDLEELQLDRDRNMVDGWALHSRIGNLMSSALVSQPERVRDHMYALLWRNNRDDLDHYQYHRTEEASKHLAAAFVEEHGTNALPVADLEESRQADVLQRKGVVVENEALRVCLKEALGDVKNLFREALTAPSKHYAWGDLTPNERKNIFQACAALDATGVSTQIVGDVDVVDFIIDTVEGCCELDTGRIRVARKTLDSAKHALTVLLHELAHRETGRTDHTPEHTRRIEQLWADVWERQTRLGR